VNIGNISIKWKISAPIIASVFALILITVIVTGERTENIVIDEVKKSTLKGYSDTIMNSLTSMMIAGNYREAESSFNEQMEKIAEVQLVRTDQVDKDFGKGDAAHYQTDAVTREVIEKGKEKIVLEGTSIRGVYPYMAKADFMGKNCLSCHKVKEGTVLGAVSIKIPLTESFSRIRALQYLFIVFGLAGILLMTVLVLLIVRITHKPILSLLETVREFGVAHEDMALSLEGGDEIALMSRNVDIVFQYLQENISALKERKAQLSQSLKDKEILLKEVHHRVKNNLQIVSSLLSLQLETLEDRTSIEALKNSLIRIKSMALIHQKLYESSDMSKLSMIEYIQELTAEILQSYDSTSERAALKLDITVAELYVDKVISCGLIICELVTNSLKYSFTDGRKGEIRIAFHQDAAGKYTLIVGDNGLGLPEGFDFNNRKTLGLQLVHDLVTRKLHGTIEIDRCNGVEFKMLFG
jgi:two-component sensor histidine kinase